MARLTRASAWAWVIIIGGLMITPGGIECIACGPIGSKVIGVISVILGAGAFVTNRQEAVGR